jgi:GT2 family glycosyltransferase/glycosyltransferase involved in cell wall biosynthesis
MEARRKRIADARKAEADKVPVFNKSGRLQCHGTWTMPDGLWTPVPKDLAMRLVGDSNYLVAGYCPPSVSVLETTAARIWKSEVQPPAPEAWPSVKLVVPVFNSPYLLQRLLKTMKITDYPGKWAAAFVDNGSTDAETLALLDGFDGEVVRTGSPVGFAAAVNMAIGKADDADLYVLLNQDCEIVSSDWLRTLIEWMILRPACAVCGPKLIFPDGHIQEAGIAFAKGTIGFHRFARRGAEHPDANYYERVQAVTGAVFCMRAEAIREIGSLDEDYRFSCEDTEFCLRAGRLGWEVWYVPTSVVMHREGAVRAANADSGRLKDWIWQSSQKFLREWEAWFDVPMEESADENENWLSAMGWRIPASQLSVPKPAMWPSVTVVIPAYNSPDLLARCLKTLRTTEYKGRMAVQVVDNASTDRKTLSLLAKEKGVTRFTKPVGFSEAVNKAIADAAPSGYYVLLNQDVAVREGTWLSTLIAFMESKPECAICGPKLLYDDGTIENAGIEVANPDGCAERGRQQAEDDPRFGDYRKVPAISGAVFCVRRSVIKRLGPFDEAYPFGCEDLAYCLRASCELGMEVWYVPTATLTHSSHAVQRQSSSADIARVRRMHAQSVTRYRKQWGAFTPHVGVSNIAFILPDFNSACGGARVVGALARQLSICGVRTEVFMRQIEPDADNDFPLFPVRPLSELSSATVVIATRFDTLPEAKAIPADRHLYLVQQIEDVMAHNCGGTKEQALASYLDKEFELITIGQSLADRLAQMGRKAHILDVGLYVSMYPFVERKPPTPKGLKVLMYAAPDFHKGPDQAEIAREIRKRIPKATIHSFHRFAVAPKWSDKHYRPVTSADVARIYADHDIYVYASLSDGFSMTPIESMACGTPVVLSDFPGKEQYARSELNCLVAPFRDPPRIAEAVETIARVPSLWLKLAKAGRQTAEHYDWPIVTRQYLKLLCGAP